MKWLDYIFLVSLVTFVPLLPLTSSDLIRPKVEGATTITPQITLAKDNKIPPPDLTAQAVTVYDLDSRQFIYQKNADTRFYPASITKIVTALVSLAHFEPDGVIQVQNGYKALGNTIKLAPQDKLTVRSILYGLLVSSGNDAALTLAENYPRGYVGFVKSMNEYATNLGLSNTHFTNPSGVVNPDHYTTAADLTILAREAISNAVIRQIVVTRSVTINSVDGQHSYYLESTNKLLGLEGVKGLKTGWTPESGECLVTLVERNGHPILITVLDSQDRFGESKQLIDWTYQNFTWKNL